MIKYGSTRVPTIDSVDFVRAPVFKDVDYSPENMVKCALLHMPGPSLTFGFPDATNFTPVALRRYVLPVCLFEKATNQVAPQAFGQLYSEILESGGPAFREVFLHLRDRPNDPVMFNCTAGKDRTGILAALILKVGFV
jgi:hypothetical protein